MSQMQSETVTAGTLDPSFGKNGVVEIEEWRAVLYSVLPLNGKLVCADQYRRDGVGVLSMRLRRMDDRGVFDTSFGDNGSTILPIHWSVAPRCGLFPYSEGKFLLKGTYLDEMGQRDMVVARLNEDGQLDTDFGEEGYKKIDPYRLYSRDAASLRSRKSFPPRKNVDNTSEAKSLTMAAGYIGGSVCVQKDGKILVAHSGIYGQDNGRYWVRGLLIRLKSDGEYDTTFGDGGKLLINLDGLDHEVISIALTDEEKILVCGSYLEDDSESAALNAFVIRFENNGKRDRSFNGDKFVIDNDELKHIRAGTISVRKNDGAIVVAGSAAETHDFNLPYIPWIAVLNANGSPNFGFNAGKPLFSSILPDGGLWQNCAWQENNNTILVARSVAARYLPTGQLDTSFNGKGWFDHKGMYNHMALTKDSKLVLIGYAGGYPFVLRSLL
jgi:uncharacterized delta-60 repeat protein